MSASRENPPLSQVELLTRSRVVQEFDCGTHESLNECLKRYALLSQLSDAVVGRANRVVGCYSLVPGSVAKRQAPETNRERLGELSHRGCFAGSTRDRPN